jgi:hypothetical protein
MSTVKYRKRGKTHNGKMGCRPFGTKGEEYFRRLFGVPGFNMLQSAGLPINVG